MMKRQPTTQIMALVLFAASVFTACNGYVPTPSVPASNENIAVAPASSASTADADTNEISIRYLEAQIRRNPDDFIAHNKLASYYLQRARETGDANYINLAGRSAQASLDILPADINTDGLTALIRFENATHEFAQARDHARELVTLKPDKSESFALLGDALLELGDYTEAARAYARMEQLSGDGDTTAVTRLARQAYLRGNLDAAQEYLSTAATRLTRSPSSTPEPRAWAYWQLGEIAFARGDYATAERRHREALDIFPDYFQATAALARARAAQDDIPAAIELYEKATRRFPDPSAIAALGDLYHLTGREREAQAQYKLVEQIARLGQPDAQSKGESNAKLYNRQLALFYADHDLKTDEAYKLAAREYEARQDIYGADALAWTALKAGKIAEAQTAIQQALKLNTQDARLFYHAGMIALRAGDKEAGRDYLDRALKLSPHFDARQSLDARAALQN